MTPNKIKKESFPHFLPVLTLAGILAAAFLLYGRILSHGFVWDDLPQIVHSEAFRWWDQLGRFFLYPHWYLLKGDTVLYYRPMLPLLILITSTFWKTNPAGYHLLSILLHGTCVWLFWIWLDRLKIKKEIGIFAALVFLVHPVLVEAVAWASAATVLLGTACALLGLILSDSLAYYESHHAERSAAVTLILLGAVFLTGLLSYPTVTMLPLLVLLIHFLFRKIQIKSKRILSAELILYGTLILFSLLLRYSSYLRMGRAGFIPHPSPYIMNVFPSDSNFEWLIRPANVLTRYLELLAFPVHLVPDRYFSSTAWSMPAVCAALFFVLATAALWKKQDHKGLLLSLGLILIPLLPFLNLLNTGGQFADRYLYFSCTGWALWLALLTNTLITEVQTRFRIPKAAFLVFPILAGYILLTTTQIKIWKDEVTFWANASDRAPQKANAHSEYGSALARAGRLEEAAEKFEDALRVAPEFLWPHIKLADLYHDLGRLEEEKRIRGKIQKLESA